MRVEAVTPDLITDDPRREVEDSPLAEAKRFMAFIKRGGGLTVGQLAACVDANPGTVSKMCVRGRLKSEFYFKQRWIPKEECASYIAMHHAEERVKNAGPFKAPPISEMWKATLKDVL